MYIPVYVWIHKIIKQVNSSFAALAARAREAAAGAPRLS